MKTKQFHVPKSSKRKKDNLRYYMYKCTHRIDELMIYIYLCLSLNQDSWLQMKGTQLELVLEIGRNRHEIRGKIEQLSQRTAEMQLGSEKLKYSNPAETILSQNFPLHQLYWISLYTDFFHNVQLLASDKFFFIVLKSQEKIDGLGTHS